MTATTLIEYDVLAEHIFDAAKLKLADDKGQQKEQFLASEVFFSNFDTDGNLISKRGNKNLVLGGAENTGAVSGGVLSFPNQDESNAAYKAILSVVDDFSFRAKVNMRIATIVTDRDIVNMVSNIDNSKIRFYLENAGGGITRIRREIVDSAGAVVSDVVLKLEDFAINPDFEISFSNDDNGDTLSYVNGVLFSTVASPAFDFTDFDFVFNDGTDAVADFDDAQLWSSIVSLATAAIAPEDTTYELLERIMLTPLPFILDEAISIDIIVQIPANAQLKHFIGLGDIQYWHDGVNWLIREFGSTIAQANTVQEIKDNFTTLPIVKGIGVNMQIGHIFKSTLGYATALIESMTVKYKFQFKRDDVSTCLIFGSVIDNSNMPVEGAIVRVQSSDKFFNDAFVGPSAKAVTNAEGKYSLSVVETETSETTVDFTVEYTEKIIEDGEEIDSPVIFEFNNRVIPNLPTKKLADLQVPA